METIEVNEVNTTAILILVAVIYVLLIVGVVFFIVLKRKGAFKQTIDPKPSNNPVKENEQEKL